ncbi:MAG: proline dehydrogenase family protein [Schleiferiaceae bacterium]
MKLDFSDTALAFQHASPADLRRARLLFGVLASPTLVSAGKSLSLWALKWRLPVKGLIRATVFRQFCGGETVAESRPAIQRLWNAKVGSILDYSVEGQTTDAAFDQTVEVALQTLALAAHEPGLSLGVFKMTGIAPHELLEHLSSGRELAPHEAEQLKKVRARIRRMAQFAAKSGRSIMIDAEETWIQGAIDQLAREAMMEFNTDRVVVMTTIQCYRVGRQDQLRADLDHAAEHGYCYGVKLVRGAYMEKERERAASMGYPSPIQPDKAHTDAEYDACLRLMLEAVGTPEQPGRVGIVVGTHNEESTRQAAEWLVARGWNPHEAPVWFAQLYGMSDFISFVLAHHGFRVAKYLPFGPIANVMPYLLRRAEENTSVAGQTGRELMMLRKETARRGSATRK